jgi:hypothetical protein
MQAVRSGLSWNAVHKFLDITGISQLDLAKYLTIPELTFARRREAGTFNRRESEQVLRLAEISRAETCLRVIPPPPELGSPPRSAASAKHALLTSPKASSVLAKCST